MREVNKKKNNFISNVILSQFSGFILIGRYLAQNAINIVADLGRSGGEFNTKLIYCISFCSTEIIYTKIQKIKKKQSMISFTF